MSFFSWKAAENSSMSFNIQIFPLIKFSGYSELLVIAITMLKRYLITILLLLILTTHSLLPKHAENCKENYKIKEQDSIFHQTLGITNIDEPEKSFVIFPTLFDFYSFLANITQYITEMLMKMMKLPNSQYLLAFECFYDGKKGKTYFVQIPLRYSWKSGTSF